MNTKWIIFSFVFGLLFFVLGCLVDLFAVEVFGAIVLFPGLIGLLEKIWPEEVVG